MLLDYHFPCRDSGYRSQRFNLQIDSLSQAFTGSIVERAVQPSGDESVTHQEGPRKVSLFKTRQKDASELTGQSKGQTMQPERVNPEVESVPKRVSKFKSQRQQVQR